MRRNVQLAFTLTVNVEERPGRELPGLPELVEIVSRRIQWLLMDDDFDAEGPVYFAGEAEVDFQEVVP